MAEDAPVPRLVFAILLAALKQGAEAIRITPRDGASVVEFRTGSEIREEMRPPARLHGALIRRLAVMASLPTYGVGEEAHGTIEIDVSGRRFRFTIVVRGHGPTLEAVVGVLPARVSDDEVVAEIAVVEPTAAGATARGARGRRSRP